MKHKAIIIRALFMQDYPYQGKLRCGVRLLSVQQMLHSSWDCVLLGKFQTTSSSQTSTQAETVNRTCSVLLLSDRETSLPIHTDVPYSYLPAVKYVGHLQKGQPEYRCWEIL